MRPGADLLATPRTPDVERAAQHPMNPSNADSNLDVANREQIGNRVVTSAALLWLTTMLLRGIQLATTGILARLLTPADYGIIALATTVVGFLDILSNIQLGSAIIRTKELTTDHIHTAFTLGLIRGCVTAALLALSAWPVSLVMHEPRLQNVLYVLTISAFLGAIHNPYFLLFDRNLDFKRDSQRTAAAAIVGSFFGIGTALYFRSYWALVAGSIATSFVMAALTYWKVSDFPRLSLKKRAELLSFGSWLLLVNVLDYVNNKVDYFLIGRGSGSQDLGAYHVGQQITTMATGDVVTPLGRALLPAFSMMTSSLDRLRESYRQVQTITLAIALPLGFGVSALSDHLVLLIVGNKWGLAGPVIAFLAPVIALQTIIASIESLALSLGKGRLLFVRTSIFLVVRTALMFIGFYLGGFKGIILARVVSGSFYLVYGLALAGRILALPMWSPIIASWRSIVSVTLMWLALYLLPAPDLHQLSTPSLAGLLALKIGFGAVVYVGSHAVLWWAAGFPNGAEQRIVEQGLRLVRRMKRSA